MNKLTKKDLLMAMDHAKDFLRQLPARAILLGTQKPLTESERIALAQLSGALTVLNSKGIDTLGISINFDDTPVEPV